MPLVRPQSAVDSALAASDAGVPDADDARAHGVAIGRFVVGGGSTDARGCRAGRATPRPVSSLRRRSARRGGVRCVGTTGSWKHWPCPFPQHGPGRKHERPIVLAAWQIEVVAAFPADFLRNLFHSDGCRVTNRTTRIVDGRRKRYAYPRWQLSNRSDDIRGLCTWALDLVGPKA